MSPKTHASSSRLLPMWQYFARSVAALTVALGLWVALAGPTAFEVIGGQAVPPLEPAPAVEVVWAGIGFARVSGALLLVLGVALWTSADARVPARVVALPLAVAVAATFGFVIVTSQYAVWHTTAGLALAALLALIAAAAGGRLRIGASPEHVVQRSARMPLARVMLLAFAAAAVPIGFVVEQRFVAGVPFDVLIRDVTQVAGLPPVTGALSQLGLLLWAAAAAICFFVAGINWTANPAVRRFLVASAVFTTVLALDDTFLWHERVTPSPRNSRESADRHLHDRDSGLSDPVPTNHPCDGVATTCHRPRILHHVRGSGRREHSRAEPVHLRRRRQVRWNRHVVDVLRADRITVAAA
ncbi:MAG: hypothetical protein GKS06_11370 [Acidobacteria bacterium]|nr:hypothetical protein [Acidobacteriota bacterium]